MKALVTGGAGFIGSHLVDKLLEDGFEVRVLDNLYSGDLDNLSQQEDNPSLQFIKGDIRKKESVEKAVDGIDVVFHEAAITSVPASVKNPELTQEVNVDGTENLLEISERLGVRKFIFASTCAVYGDPETVPLSEKSPVNPSSPYAESKLSAEKKCKKYEGGDLETVVFRYFNVYGPRQGGGKYSGVISKFLDRIEAGNPPIIYGDGEQTRDFVHVEDIVRANMLAFRKDNNISGQVFNIGTGDAVSINELCQTILDLTGNEDQSPIYQDPREGDIRYSEADIEKVRERLDYQPEISLREGLETIISKRDNL